MVEIAAAIYVVGQAAGFVFGAVVFVVAAWSVLGGK
jgi:hypothetical protein